MPFVKSGNEYKSPSGRTFTKKQVKMYYATNGFTKKKKPTITVNNKMKGAMGSINLNRQGKYVGKPKIEINLKAHKKNGKLDKSELASSIKHELTHAKHPKMPEKEVYKRTAKTKISPQEQTQLLSKLRGKTLNYRVGAAKRKLGMGKKKVEPGALITNMNAQKVAQNKAKSNNSMSRSMRVSIMGA